MKQDFDAERQMMVDSQIKRRGVSDPHVLQAMAEVPRHRFIPEKMRPNAYGDGPLPIGYNQTISQPYIVALMTQAATLKPEHTVLEIGTGSGYAAAVLSRIVKKVYTIERIHELAESASATLEELGYTNVEVKEGDGTLGLPEYAPFDAILVTAGAPVIPESFLGQLSKGGCVIIPVGDAISQELIRLRNKNDGSYIREHLEYVRFVPLIGEEGWI